MMSMPFMGNMMQQPNPEQTAKMQLLALQNQQLQLRQARQMLEQYTQSVDTALKQIDEQIAKLEEGDTADIAVQAQILQVHAQALSHSLLFDPQRALAQRFQDRFSDPLRADPQNWVMAGMGDFGRPVF
jgi:hypothetical protein